MHSKWGYKKYISFNNYSAKKAKEQKIKQVKQVMRAKRQPPKPAQPTVTREKDQLIRSIQIRWWYLLPDWPESDFDYTQALCEKGLKIVSDRELAADNREAGVVDKVKPIGGFPGLYVTRRGRIYDVRDKSTCPSYNNLAEKTEAELETMLLAAIQSQLSVLRTQVDFDTDLAAKLEEN